MVTLSLEQVALLEARLTRLEPGPSELAARALAKAERRAERWARFEASARDGLAFSRACVRRIRKFKGDGGARLEYQMKRIVQPDGLRSHAVGGRNLHR
jgi:hypothetical protein